MMCCIGLGLVIISAALSGPQRRWPDISSTSSSPQLIGLYTDQRRTLWFLITQFVSLCVFVYSFYLFKTVTYMPMIQIIQ